MARVMEINTPLGKDVLLFQDMSATEELGRLFEYQIGALSLKNDIDPAKLLGKNVTVKLELAGGGHRHFDGYVTRFGAVGSHGRHTRYQMTVRPWLWLLTLATDCRIFQDKTVPEIVKEIFDKYPNAVFENRLTASYRKWEYCVQYRESDFNFVSRLMEQEGIYYFFTHADNKHTLVLADSAAAHEPFPGYAQIPFIAQDQATRLEQERIGTWQFSRRIEPGKYVLDDYDFKKPSTELQVRTKIERDNAEANHEHYDYPGEYLAPGEGEHYVRVRLEELQAERELAEGTGNARGLAVGRLFKLSKQARADQNREYLIVGAHYRLDYNEYEAQEGAGADFTCSFTAMSSKEPYRPRRATPKPFVQGPQTAVVVGPAGDEIYTDNFGRVKVQFHWDRLGKQDQNSSCWMRVSHPWAGKNWGMVAIPRIGQEVIVDFLEGDPDRPIITGRVYNAEQMPPYELPANKTQTGIKTRSSMSGTPANFNEIRFEDKKGAEQLFIHAEKNQDIEVENDETHWVGHDRRKTIDHDETVHVKHDRTETVGNNETIAIGVNRTETVGNNETISIGVNRTEQVGANETISIGANRTETVGANESVTIGGNRIETVAIASAENVGAAKALSIGAGYAVTVGGAMNTAVGGASFEEVGITKQVVVGQSLRIQAGDSIELVCGKSVLILKKDGTVNLNGKNIDISGDSHIQLGAERIDIN